MHYNLQLHVIHRGFHDVTQHCYILLRQNVFFYDGVFSMLARRHNPIWVIFQNIVIQILQKQLNQKLPDCNIRKICRIKNIQVDI